MHDQLTPYDSELLLAGVEGTFLIEMRNGVASLPVDDVSSYREKVGEALVKLVDRGLLAVRVAVWRSDRESEPLSRPELIAMLDDGSAWDPEVERLVVVESTDAGEAAFRTACSEPREQ